MKKTSIIVGLLCTCLVQAQTYTSEGVYTADSKNTACSKALSQAQVSAMEKAGTLVLSDFSSRQGYIADKTHKSAQHKLRTMALGIAKLEKKTEQVEVTKSYQFICSVNATFTIEQDELKEQYKKLLENEAQEEKQSGYYEAKGYSENGQSRYKAFTAAKLVAQRNLLEEIKGTQITSLTKIDSGELQDKIAKLLNGTLQGAKTIKQEYDVSSQSAYVLLRISKAKVHKALEQ